MGENLREQFTDPKLVAETELRGSFGSLKEARESASIAVDIVLVDGLTLSEYTIFTAQKLIERTQVTYGHHLSCHAALDQCHDRERD